jgi:hypothetical protein
VERPTKPARLDGRLAARPARLDELAAKPVLTGATLPGPLLLGGAWPPDALAQPA